MKLIGRRKRKSVPEQVFGYLRLALKGLVAQRLARRAYRNYVWMRRLPFLLGAAAIAALIARQATKKRGDEEVSPPTTTATTPAPATAPATTPSTPTPTGSPTAVTPAPTAAAEGDGSPSTERSADDSESKS